ncbi:WD40 repeat-like protein [Amylocystis lapponica]|nr:WD40 repeat-like protein [Amylocystis lapponica]
MPSAWEIYSEHLFRLGHGLPLWDPEPTKMGPVLVGDVGYTREGAFYRLFNATHPAKHRINARYGVPVGYKPFRFPDFPLNRRDAAIPAGPLCSRSVRSVTVGGQVGVNAGLGGGGAGLQFQCTDEQGALLVMKEPATREELHPSRRMANYMRQNHQSWYTFATEVCDLDIEREDIIFVRGWVKTAEWAVAAFVHEGRAAQLTFSGDFTAGANASFTLATATNVTVLPEVSAGPRGMVQQGRRASLRITGPPDLDAAQDQLHEQCVFLHYYKMKMRFFWPRVMKAAAGPHELPSSGDHDYNDTDVAVDVAMEDEMEIEQVPASRSFDPVGYLLDYILEHSNAEVAIANDADILTLCKDREIPDDIKAFLDATQPHIEVNEDGLGMLSIEMLAAEVPASAEAVASEQSLEVDAPGASITGPPPPIPPPPSLSHTETTDEDVDHDDTSAVDENKTNDDKGKGVASIARQGDVIVLDDHTGGVCSLAFSADGIHVASGSEDSTIIIWDARTGQKVYELNVHDDTVCTLAFSPDGQELVSGARDGRVILWTVETGEPRAFLDGHDGFVYSVVFSPDGQSVASASVDFTVRLWDTATGQALWSSDGHHAVVMLVAFSPDGKQIVSASADYSARIWDTETGTERWKLEGHEGVIYSIAFSPDGRRVVTGSDDGSCRIWSAQTGDELVTLREHTGSVWAAAFSPDGKNVLSAASDGTVKICDSFSGERVLVREQGDALVTAAAFSADGGRICAAAGDNALRVWSARSGRCLVTLEGHTDKVSHLKFSPDGDHIVSSSDDSTLRVWNLAQVWVGADDE